MKEHLVSSPCLPCARGCGKEPFQRCVCACSGRLSTWIMPYPLMAFPEDTPGTHLWVEGRQVAVGSPGK